MKTVTVFRLAVVIGTAAYVACWALPYLDGYLDPDVARLLSFNGFNAVYYPDKAIAYAEFVAWIVCAVGLLLFRKIARSLFLVLIVLSTAMTPLYGVFIESAGGMALLGISQMADGVVLALAYLSPVKERFY